MGNVKRKKVTKVSITQKRTDVHTYIITSQFWNRHYEVSKKVRHFKFGPVVQKLQAFKDTRIEKEKICFRKTGSPLSFADISGVRCLTEFIRISKCSY